MDPQKPPLTNKTPENPTTETPPSNVEVTETSPLPENDVKPGTVVVGGAAASDPTSPTPETPEPSVPANQDRVAEFMREPSTTTVPPAPVRGKSKAGPIALIVAVVLLVLGGAAAYYFAYFVPNKPENVLKAAMVNSFSTEKVKSMSFDATISGTDADGQKTFGVEMTGSTSQENGQIKQLAINATIDALVANLTFDLRSVDGKNFYAKVGGLAGLPELLAASGDPSAEAYTPLIDAVNEQWYEINESLIEQFLGTPATGSGALSEADLQKLKDAYDRNQFLVATETLASEKINGVDSHHYKVTIDKTKLKAFLTAVKDANIQALGLTPELYSMLNSGIDGADFSKYPVEVWVAKDSKLFTGFAFTTQSEGETTSVKVTLKDYNKELTVEKPEGAKPILEVINTLYQAFLSSGLSFDLPAESTDGISL